MHDFDSDEELPEVAVPKTRKCPHARPQGASESRLTVSHHRVWASQVIRGRVAQVMHWWSTRLPSTGRPSTSLAKQTCGPWRGQFREGPVPGWPCGHPCVYQRELACRWARSRPAKAARGVFGRGFRRTSHYVNQKHSSNANGRRPCQAQRQGRRVITHDAASAVASSFSLVQARARDLVAAERAGSKTSRWKPVGTKRTRSLTRPRSRALLASARKKKPRRRIA